MTRQSFNLIFVYFFFFFNFCYYQKSFSYELPKNENVLLIFFFAINECESFVEDYIE